jgi:pre-rRNA-processing protein TSR4
MTEAKPSHSKTLRGSTILKATETPEAKDLGCTLFAAKPFSAGQPSSNPFSTNPFTITLPNPQFPPPTDLPATFAQKACISSAIALPATIPRPAEPWPSDSLLPAAYPSYRLGADYETLDSIREAPIHTQAVDLTDYASGSAGNDKEDTETFESTIDKTFQRFADRLAQNPLQILRYEFQGTPLLYSKTDAVGKLLAPPLSGRTSVQSCGGGLGMPQCANCGAGRVFELQLMPRAIVELEVDEDGLDGMEWGTLVLGVCGQDCQARRVSAGEVGYVEEWIGVQWEEQKRR